MRLFKGFIWSLGVCIASIGCTDINENVGSDYMRDDQETLIKYKLFSNGVVPSLTDGGDDDRLFSFSEYIDTDFNMANLSYGATGSQYTENFGKRVSGFYSQYTPSYTLDSDGFGSSPLISALAMYLPVSEYSGDTTVVHKYNVYMVLDDSFLEDDKYTFTESESESLFGDAANNSNLVRIFSFQFPDQSNGVYFNSSAVVLYSSSDTALTEAFENTTTGVSVTDECITLLNRLLLKNVYGYEQLIYTDYDYDDHDVFIEQFKGLYIEVESDATDNLGPADSGSSFLHYLSECGFGFSGYESQADWTEAIADEAADGSTDISMIGMVYSFDDENTAYGRNSINHVVRSEQPVADEDENNVYIESMGGRISDMRISKSFFEWMDAQIDAANDDEENTIYTDIFFSRASIYAYIPYMTDYELVTNTEGILGMTKQMNAYQQRVCMYELYTNTYDDDYETLLETVLDYDTISEAYYGTTSIFNGYLNHTLGRYEMNIQHQMQIMWAEWSELENKDTITDEEWEALDWNRVHVGPSVDNFASVRYVTLQGANNNDLLTGVGAPMQLDVIYTLRK